MVTTYYVLEVGGEAPIEELLFPEWANIRLLLDTGWSQTFGDGRVVCRIPELRLAPGVYSVMAARASAPPSSTRIFVASTMQSSDTKRSKSMISYDYAPS